MELGVSKEKPQQVVNRPIALHRHVAPGGAMFGECSRAARSLSKSMRLACVLSFLCALVDRGASGIILARARRGRLHGISSVSF